MPRSERSSRRHVALRWCAAIVLLGAHGAQAYGPFSATPPPGLPGAKEIVDIHVHVAGVGNGCTACFVARTLKDSYKFTWYLRGFGTSASEMNEQGDAVVVTRIRNHIRSSQWVRHAQRDVPVTGIFQR